MILDRIRAWWERRRIIREIAADRRAESDRDAIRFEEILGRAEAAVAADQRTAALRLSHEIQERFFKRASESSRFFKTALKLKQYDDAERLINAGLARYPRENFFIVGRAQVAEERGDIETALERWAVVRQKFPWLALGYARTAACLIKAGRMSEADAMLARGIKKSRDDASCLIEHAKLAEALNKPEEALVRWQHLCDVQPDEKHPCRQIGTIGIVRCLRKMSHFDEAEALLRPFIERFGVEEVTLMEFARIAEDRGDWVDALARWQRVTRVYPMFDQGYRGVIEVLKKSGQKGGVDAVLEEMVDRFPDELWPALDYAQSAHDKDDKAEIARRWAMVRERFPDCEIAYRNGADALAAMGQEDAAASVLTEHKTRFAV